MAKKNGVSTYSEQKKSKPAIETVIHAHLNGDLKDAALDFLSFIKSLRMTPQWASANSYAVNHKNKRVCYLKFHDGGWRIDLYTKYDDDFNETVCSENCRDVFSNNVVHCLNCSACAPGKNAVILGEIFLNVCIMPVLRLVNPDAKTRECFKKLIVLRRKQISENRVPKVTYIAMKDRQ